MQRVIYNIDIGVGDWTTYLLQGDPNPSVWGSLRSQSPYVETYFPLSNDHSRVSAWKRGGRSTSILVGIVYGFSHRRLKETC